ncbi:MULTISPECIES: DUF6415 family natural product biosynthesis protein [Streptomyces]|uniref:Uncharacterized protein n=1 Tax=Streptomyces scabiei (strain 87.22) TaxID=680198 RepID=C9ZD35_STRSW|nr:DUF6415 family natural product biosynthesis protein [Streptomyces scabiei]MBP5908867.1 hypothetical protein [Streptomyces sp. LBUM 1478]MBP5927544.1 hypothetical protein [Streptomyces sp. LBUM 1479]MDX2532518.1 DUF6415 family natural product biosynthesis protein [Streptomyces scabiei]MDX2579420.1 DUF6415 family natural product biosynthesis protein [Streptomyces scabiei]MDX2658214.1 DUF6415 family natural product biosynthesis protein [Streptomyces scabiei]
MPNCAARTSAAADLDDPPDITTMRSTADRILAFDAQPIAPKDLETFRICMRGQIELLIPAVQGLAARFPKGDIPRECALAGAREASMRLRLDVGGSSPVRMSVSMKLARSVVALCDHYENLGGR